VASDQVRSCTKSTIVSAPADHSVSNISLMDNLYIDNLRVYTPASLSWTFSGTFSSSHKVSVSVGLSVELSVLVVKFQFQSPTSTRTEFSVDD
jgi:hypothetical protein